MVDAALVRVQFVLRGCTRHVEFKIQSTKVASAKVAFDTVRSTIATLHRTVRFPEDPFLTN